MIIPARSTILSGYLDTNSVTARTNLRLTASAIMMSGSAFLAAAARLDPDERLYCHRAHRTSRSLHVTPALLSDKTMRVGDPYVDDKRHHRPMSPSVRIFKPWITWTLSITHRLTGVGVGLLFTAPFAIYALVPFSTATVVSFVSASPYPLVLAVKLTVGASAVFKFAAGLRHLVWDARAGRSLELDQVYMTGYICIAAGLVGGLILAIV
ncbi:hypothetical protein M427DRAFT_31408 [Gonapodya prolifera JEL478]|uniref:Cytochrome b560 subunit of succinate dehydrogenase n=1 Tax=Gonapodya prolifera (strain JEL478) TaxID=1344416 RepID=A0A139AHM8_GONPJ|nr:hypothetical protein M427DRAFT_31408 [Gonapodya prolifera JEL478]|eukprot:KXS16238.1 hypothetical protein M427DRAFT_31408 [Gonapodya prolifera JEL478]